MLGFNIFWTTQFSNFCSNTCTKPTAIWIRGQPTKQINAAFRVLISNPWRTAIITASKLHAANIDIAINQRQAAALIRAQTALQQVLTTIECKLPLDFWTIDLREAIRALGEVTGEEVTESVLDRIFSRFCIGK